jgi:CRISPR/Cas system CSM-associated protein Csm3 (group 7 of RAMP superfamily)
MTYYKSNITGKFLLQGTFKAESALKIASGASDESDSDVLLNSAGQPYIPGTSLAGALYAALREKSDIDKTKLDSFWGRDNKRESQLDISHCKLVSEAPETEIRDGIKINPKTQQTEANAKYDYQVIPAGVEFSYLIVVNDVVNDTGEKGFSQNLASVIAKIFNEGFSIGGHKNKGKGLLKNKEANHRYFDFTQKEQEHVYDWIDRNLNGGCVFKPDSSIVLKKPRFQVSGSFYIPDALIIGSAAAANSSNKSDKVHLKSGGKNILSGTSLKGALKARARIIANTIGIEKTEEMLEYLFGRKSEKKANKTAANKRLSSRFVCNEPFIVVEKDADNYPQHRIKTDRFTGGTIKGGKFDSAPLWGGTIANLSFSVNDATNQEIGLLLLLYADLYRGDIVFGGEKNIGRGVIKGVNATISVNDTDCVKDTDSVKDTEFKINGTPIDQETYKLLDDKYVNALHELKTA